MKRNQAIIYCFIVVQLLSHIWLFATPWTAAHQLSLSITNSQSLLKLMSIESVIPSSHLTLCHPLPLPSTFPSVRVFSNESAFASGGQSIGASASASALAMNIQGWFPLGWTGLISLLSKALSRVSQYHLGVYGPWGWSLEVSDGYDHYPPLKPPSLLLSL